MAITADEVQLQRSGKRGRYSYTFPDGDQAELTFSERQSGIMAIDHTYTPRHHRGQGIAAVLVERAVADARQNGTKVVPACSFAREQFALHPDWKDLLAR